MYSVITNSTRAQEGSLWSSDGPSSSSATSEVYAPDRVPSYLQRERLPRFQPTFPYLPHAIIDLPPTISLSDGEEPPPYQGPCSLQLRDPEQQLELNRESVRAPPNRTVFDGPLISAAPPAYSEVIGHYYPPTSQTQPTAIHISRMYTRNTRNKDKAKAQHV
ncbi:protein TMEPAI [Sinocyclocheilus grahami]|uniref:protein TMEPAI n=1 Tax=Sinocyclocheilus grahami TaxID=75366 RepID=UPI0007ACAE6D|nr:PREDICTED: protein TMEPAI-like [Sinocyclocheilus grahami]